MDGTLHVYWPQRLLTLFEHTYCAEAKNRSLIGDERPIKNVLLLLGGLGDSYSSPPYVAELVAMLPRDRSDGWAVVEIQLSSSRRQFGICNLDSDVEEIAKAVDFIHGYTQRTIDEGGGATTAAHANVVLMGHSTGCQDIMHYLNSAPCSPGEPLRRPAIQGAILQAPASDREALALEIEQAAEPETARAALRQAMSLLDATPSPARRREILLPLDVSNTLGWFGTPVTLARFASLLSPNSPTAPSDEDLFSSDLPDEVLKDTFGQVGRSPFYQCAAAAARAVTKQRESQGEEEKKTKTKKPDLLILISGADQFMPPSVDKARLLQRWTQAVEHDGTARVSPYSGVLTESAHCPDGAARADMLGRVLAYLRTVAG